MAALSSPLRTFHNPWVPSGFASTFSNVTIPFESHENEGKLTLNAVSD